MQSEILKVGNAQGFWGDSPGAPARLVAQQPDLDYLTLDYLAEVSMSIMAIQREKDPSLGYARDFIEVIRSLVPLWKEGSNVKVVTNAGGLNPLACAHACAAILQSLGAPLRTIGVVYGDDVLPILKGNPENPLFRNLETEAPLNSISDLLVTGNAYFGAAPIADLLRNGADIVITGRVADPSLTVGPCAAHFGWSFTEYDKIAGATIAGHLIECGAQATGGISTEWLTIPDPANIGYPVVEVSSDGSCILTKPNNTGGRVNAAIVKEQLLYEIGDPSAYLSPDATVSFLALEVTDLGNNRVRVSGAKGKSPPPTYKVSATYRDGYKAEGFLAIVGADASLKARRCGEIIRQRVENGGFVPDRFQIECLGAGDVVPGVLGTSPNDLRECVLRVAMADKRLEALECFSREIAPLVTSGPQGVTGYTSGRPHIRPVFGYWPCLIETKRVAPTHHLLEPAQ